eukprot:TRINITY_DN629_c0_g1_i14.p3 TRINITY_DN629_c0_g1~~TRINITY_DN629_c0_g1_i14.p3  ORF type:complete len:115 (+),score=7.00 TRINITY_DN629_c0_g1_i14:538-882(+)
MDRLQLFCLFITNSLLRSIISSKVYATSKGTTFDADVVQLNTWIAVWVLPALMDEVCRAGVKYYWSTKEETAPHLSIPSCCVHFHQGNGTLSKVEMLHSRTPPAGKPPRSRAEH